MLHGIYITYIYNKVLYTDLKVPTVREKITKFSIKYRDKITAHPHEVASRVLQDEEEGGGGGEEENEEKRKKEEEEEEEEEEKKSLES
jgi:hypothetical protein